MKPQLTSIKDFRKTLTPGALLQVSHYSIDGPRPRVFKRHLSKGQVEFLAYYDPAKEILDWTEAYISILDDGNWVVEDNHAILQMGPHRTITYEFLEPEEFEALVRQAHPEVADRLLASEKLTRLLPS